MKDLDFDELDRAVNSLITSVPGAANNNEVKEKTLEIKPDSVSIDQPAAAATPAPAVRAAMPVATSPLAARRSTGRFMDVVPPSNRVTLTAPERVSRQGMNVAPSVPVAPVAPAPITTPEVTKPSNEWPDPINATNNDSGDNNEDNDIDQINDDITNTINNESNDSLDSPFISGTKVEKRPLGAFSDEADTKEAPLAVESDSENTKSTDPEPVNTESFPAELQDDLLSIESGNAVTQSTEKSVSNTENTPTSVDEPIEPVVAPVDNQPMTDMSITQQYKEQPSSGDQTSGAIYDTDAYHKALIGSSKKKTGWLWVLWIALLLLVGAGAGAAVYFFVLK